eukprot:2875258-Amphidinium_carterae.1
MVQPTSSSELPQTSEASKLHGSQMKSRTTPRCQPYGKWHAWEAVMRCKDTDKMKHDVYLELQGNAYPASYTCVNPLSFIFYPLKHALFVRVSSLDLKRAQITFLKQEQTITKVASPILNFKH